MHFKHVVLKFQLILTFNTLWNIIPLICSGPDYQAGVSFKKIFKPQRRLEEEILCTRQSGDFILLQKQRCKTRGML